VSDDVRQPKARMRFKYLKLTGMTAFLISAILVINHVWRRGIDIDAALNYAALGMLIFVVITIFYGVIVIHDVPYEIARARNHPHQDAIHAAGWVSLFTLHAIWPFLWIWAMLYRPERGWGFKQPDIDASNSVDLVNDLLARIEVLEGQQRLARTKEMHRHLPNSH
jgi:hypothetical protein